MAGDEVISKSLNTFLTKIYYDPNNTGSFGGIDRLWRAVKKTNRKGVTKNDVRRWAKSQDVYTLYRPARRNYPRRTVYVSMIDEMWECDLIVMKDFDKFNEGNMYMLVVIDALSKYLMVEHLKRKNADTIVRAFAEVLKNGRKPICLRSDKGGEFIGAKVQRFLKSQDIRYFVTSNETKACYCERVIRTLKSRMWRFFEHKETYDYIQVVEKLVENYNNSYHRTIKMSPISVTKDNDHLVWENAYLKSMKIHEKNKKIKFKFKVGQYVRYSYKKKVFDKGYEENWSGELFKITEKLYTKPPTYKLADYSGEKMLGSAYEQEIQHVIKSKDALWKIEEVVREERRDGQLYYLVKWKGWPNKYNTWLTADQLEDL